MKTVTYCLCRTHQLTRNLTTFRALGVRRRQLMATVPVIIQPSRQQQRGSVGSAMPAASSSAAVAYGSSSSSRRPTAAVPRRGAYSAFQRRSRRSSPGVGRSPFLGSHSTQGQTSPILGESLAIVAKIGALSATLRPPVTVHASR
jgi:hypothetical protein